MIFGTYDILIVLVVLGLNSLVLSFRALMKLRFLIIPIGILLYLFVLPYISARLEAIQVRNEYKMVDSFNLLYLYFRFPAYWILGILNFVVVALIIRRRPFNQLNTLLKRAIRIATKTNCNPIYTYSAANDLHLTLEELQNEFENGDSRSMEKLLKIFSPNSDWTTHFGNEQLRRRAYTLLTQLLDRKK